MKIPKYLRLRQIVLFHGQDHRQRNPAMMAVLRMHMPTIDALVLKPFSLFDCHNTNDKKIQIIHSSDRLSTGFLFLSASVELNDGMPLGPAHVDVKYFYIIFEN